MVSGILVPQPGIETQTPVMEAYSLHQWITREAQCLGILDEGDINSSFHSRRVTPLIIHT